MQVREGVARISWFRNDKSWNTTAPFYGFQQARRLCCRHVKACNLFVVFDRWRLLQLYILTHVCSDIVWFSHSCWGPWCWGNDQHCKEFCCFKGHVIWGNSMCVNYKACTLFNLFIVTLVCSWLLEAQDNLQESQASGTACFDGFAVAKLRQWETAHELLMWSSKSGCEGVLCMLMIVWHHIETERFVEVVTWELRVFDKCTLHLCICSKLHTYSRSRVVGWQEPIPYLLMSAMEVLHFL